MNRYQAPKPEIMMNSNNDEAFLTLLSSQRELLTQLNRENAERRVTGNNGYHHPQGTGTFGSNGFDATLSASMSTMGSTLYPSATNNIVTPNHSICEHQTSSSANGENVLYSKRFSLGLGNDYFGMTPTASVTGFGDDLMKASSFGPDPIGCDIVPFADMKANTKKRDKDDFGFDEFFSAKKRRLSNAALIQSIFSEESHQPHQQQQQLEQSIQRRFSLTSFVESGLEMPSFLDSSTPAEENKDDLVTWQTATKPSAPVVLTPTPVTPTSKPKKAKQTNKAQAQMPLIRTMDPQEARAKLMSLSSAMEKTQKSQQDIHDWDRKMGLKRSHSKTMRLTTRSRKKLRAMLKKQMNALTSKKR
ncbi:expressed unknown protein [Seminavis robusta]|uniref:Uncharacterized protein n=1 Tax=Seminavis robusta TaxID=568900 RepID=A0A9N8EUK1_9STRA|nr:expressed unknown protein [Seminavis robusta]|eukprot:Sro2230_g320020.1 n/a (360) ;mRNA; r:12201-13373